MTLCKERCAETAIVRLQPDVSGIRPAVLETMHLCRQIDATLSDDTIDNIQVALSEALNNVVEHAFVHLPASEVCLCITCGPSKLCVTIVDSGAPLPEALLSDPGMPDLDVAPDALPEGGFGWSLIHTLTKDIAYQREDGINRLCLIFE